MAGQPAALVRGDAFRFGLSLDEIQSLTNIDRWFLVQIQEIVALEKKIAEEGPAFSWRPSCVRSSARASAIAHRRPDRRQRKNSQDSTLQRERETCL
jgi:hypothetical protein